MIRKNSSLYRIPLWATTLFLFIGVAIFSWLGQETRIINVFTVAQSGELILEPLSIENNDEQLPNTWTFLVSNASWYDQNLLRASNRDLRGDEIGRASCRERV